MIPIVGGGGHWGPACVQLHCVQIGCGVWQSTPQPVGHFSGGVVQGQRSGIVVGGQKAGTFVGQSSGIVGQWACGICVQRAVGGSVKHNFDGQASTADGQTATTIVLHVSICVLGMAPGTTARSPAGPNCMPAPNALLARSSPQGPQRVGISVCVMQGLATETWHFGGCVGLQSPHCFVHPHPGRSVQTGLRLKPQPGMVVGQSFVWPQPGISVGH
jgi:hypothetical protein